MTTFAPDRCPLCDGANRCAMAAGASDASRCWCAGATLDATALRCVPAAARGITCLCAACAGVSSGVAATPRCGSRPDPSATPTG